MVTFKSPDDLVAFLAKARDAGVSTLDLEGADGARLKVDLRPPPPPKSEQEPSDPLFDGVQPP